VSHQRQRLRRRLLWVSGVLCLALAGGATFVGIKLRASLPVLAGTQYLTGLAWPVHVTSDRYGIPTITAQTRADALRALGYVTARDRLFQMDLLRRHSAGRLAEIFGKAALPGDIEQRGLGFHRVAATIVTALPPEQREVLRAYTEGVNAFITRLLNSCSWAIGRISGHRKIVSWWSCTCFRRYPDTRMTNEC
jgi:penicillin amidase